MPPSPGGAFNFNRYAYAANNPIGNLDPTGESCEGNQSGDGASTDCPNDPPLQPPVIVTAAAPAIPFTLPIFETLAIPRFIIMAPNPYVVLVAGLVYPGNMATCQEISCMPGMHISKGKKIPKPGMSGKEGSKDVPSWAKGERPNVGESGKEFADRIFGKKYGGTSSDKGPGSEWSKIRKWGDRAFVDP